MNTYEHIFKDHNLKRIHEYALFNNSNPLIWPSVLLIICIALFVFLKVYSPSKLVNILRSSVNIQSIKQLERDEFNPLNTFSFALSTIFVIVLSFFVYRINSDYMNVLKSSGSFVQYLFFFTVICLFNLLKFGIKNLLGFITNTMSLTNELFYNNLVINQALGIALLPAFAVVQFSNFSQAYIMIFSGIIFISSFFIKVYRGFIFSIFEHGVGFLQVFIYLCALEILPVLVLIKFIITNF